MYDVSTEDEDNGSALKRSVYVNTTDESWDSVDNHVGIVDAATGLHIRDLSSKKPISICHKKVRSRKVDAHKFNLQSRDIRQYTILDNEDWGDCNNCQFPAFS